MSSVTANILRKGIAKGNSNLLSEIELVRIRKFDIKKYKYLLKKMKFLKILLVLIAE